MEYKIVSIQDSLLRRCVFLFIYIFLDLCSSFTVVSGSSNNNDVICDRRNQTVVDNLPRYCQNNGLCTSDGCDCSGGYYGTICQHSVINAVIVVVVCILPPASWTMVFCYGCKERRRKRRLRQERLLQRRQSSANDISPTLFAEDLPSDLPPNYYEISHDNPIALYSMDEAPWPYSQGQYETTDGVTIAESPLNDPPPPDYNEVLKKAIESGAVLPIQATQNTTHSSNDGVNNTVVATVSDENLPSSSSGSPQTLETRNPPAVHCTTLSGVIILNEHLTVHSSQEDLVAADEIAQQYLSTESHTRDNVEVHDGGSGASEHGLSSVMDEQSAANSSQEDLIASQRDEETQQERREVQHTPPSSVVIIMDEHLVSHLSTEDLVASQLDEEDMGHSNNSIVPETLLSLAHKFKAKTKSSSAAHFV